MKLKNLDCVTRRVSKELGGRKGKTHTHLVESAILARLEYAEE
jgi:hypothetical protein